MAAERPVVLVVGGGIAGLAAAWTLASIGAVKVLLVEASPRLGGKMATGTCAGTTVELGPDQFLRRDPSLEQLCRELGLGEDLVAPAGGGAGVLSRGVLRALPKGLVLGVPTDLDAVARSGIVSESGIERARLDLASSAGPSHPFDRATVGLDADMTEREQSAGAILRGRLGDEVVDRLVDPLLGGINAGSLDTLSLGTVAPQIAHALLGEESVLAALARSRTTAPQTASPFFGLRGGLCRLVERLAADLERRGVEIWTGALLDGLYRNSAGASPGDSASASKGRLGPLTARVSSTSAAQGSAGRRIDVAGVVLAVPAFALAPIVEGVAPEAARAAREIDYAGVAVSTFAFPSGSVGQEEGWSGFLVPRVEGRLMTAVTYLSHKWEWMGGDEVELVRVSAGRHNDTRALELGDDELLDGLRGELASIAGITAEPVDTRVDRWNNAFPQYRPGHKATVARLEDALSGIPQLRLAGALLGGIGMPACATSGEQAATALLDSLGMLRG